MRFYLEIACDNAAFVEAGPEAEVARILRETAERIENRRPANNGRCVDINGNRVGGYAFDDDPPKEGF